MSEGSVYHLYNNWKHRFMGIIPEVPATLVLDPLSHCQIFPTHIPQLLDNLWCPQNLFHILWACPYLSNFWPMDFHTIARVVNFAISISLEMALLSLGIDTVPPSHRSLVTYILLAANLTPVRHGKDSNNGEVIQITNLHANF